MFLYWQLSPLLSAMTSEADKTTEKCLHNEQHSQGRARRKRRKTAC